MSKTLRRGFWKALGHRLAPLASKSRTEFVRDGAQREAEAVLDQRLFRIDMRAFQAFVETLDQPGNPAALKRLAKVLRTEPPWES